MVVSCNWGFHWQGSFPQLLNRHLALVLLSSSESFENSLDIKLTAMTDIKQLLKEFERFAYGQSLHTAFSELHDWTAVTLLNNAMMQHRKTLHLKSIKLTRRYINW
jgi:hypothetical protein